MTGPAFAGGLYFILHVLELAVAVTSVHEEAAPIPLLPAPLVSSVFPSNFHSPTRPEVGTDEELVSVKRL